MEQKCFYESSNFHLYECKEHQILRKFSDLEITKKIASCQLQKLCQQYKPKKRGEKLPDLITLNWAGQKFNSVAKI